MVITVLRYLRYPDTKKKCWFPRNKYGGTKRVLHRKEALMERIASRRYRPPKTTNNGDKPHPMIFVYSGLIIYVVIQITWCVRPTLFEWLSFTFMKWQWAQTFRSTSNTSARPLALIRQYRTQCKQSTKIFRNLESCHRLLIVSYGQQMIVYGYSDYYLSNKSE